MNSDKNYIHRSTCRSCGSDGLINIIDLGKIPIADALLSKDELNTIDLQVPLTLAFCPECCLLQIREDVDPEVLFCRNYPYYSSVNSSALKHFTNSAEKIIEKYSLNNADQVLELASNDGYMLKTFMARGIPILGIDPASGPAQVAIDQGIDTRIAFFSSAFAEQLKTEGKEADIIIANNVLAHVPDLNDFVSGVKMVLKDEGKLILEVPYAIKMIRNLEFDTIFHQHYSYFTLSALEYLFAKQNLRILDVEEIAIHGGSIRVTVGHTGRPSEAVLNMLNEEKKNNATQLEFYRNFAAEVDELRTGLKQTLADLKAQGSTIAGYGAAGKANTLLSFCAIGSETLDFIADISTHKIGKFFPGNHLPIVAPEKVLEDQPDYLLILAWNFADSIMDQLQAYKRAGGKFIIPIPELRIV